MKRVAIYKREGLSLSLVAIWKNGNWSIDHEDFADINNIDQYDEEMILDRFDGPIYFGVKEENAPLTPEDIGIETSNNATEESEEGFISDFMQGKLDRVEEYKNDEITEDDFTEEQWSDIEDWVEKYG